MSITKILSERRCQHILKESMSIMELYFCQKCGVIKHKMV